MNFFKKSQNTKHHLNLNKFLITFFTKALFHKANKDHVMIPIKFSLK